jgi:glutaconate CoA-transferase subunit A
MGLQPVTAWEAVAGIPDGASLALGRPAAMALVEELIRQGRSDLQLVGVPTGGRAVELLIAAGCACSLESSGVDLGEDGLAPAFSRAVESGALRMIDSSCPAMLMALQAGASGISFTPVPGLLDTDLLLGRPDFRVIDDPYRPGERVVLVPALAPEFALLHGRRADLEGNVVIGTEYTTGWWPRPPDTSCTRWRSSARTRRRRWRRGSRWCRRPGWMRW